MSIAALIRAMASAGATPEAIAIAVEAIEEAHANERDRRALQAERKRRQRANERDMSRDSHGTVTGQGRDSHRNTLPPLSPPLPSPKPPTNTPPIIPHPEPHNSGGRAIKSKQPKIDRAADLKTLGCSESLICEWQAVRKAKDGGPITETVVEMLKIEADLAGITVQEAVRLSVQNGWRGFKAVWLKNQSNPQQQPRAGPADPPRPLRGSAAIADALNRITADAPNSSPISRGAPLGLSDSR